MQKEFKKSGVDGAWNRLVTEWGHEFFNAKVIAAHQPHQNAKDDANRGDLDDDKFAKDQELNLDATESLDDDDEKSKLKSKSKNVIALSSSSSSTTTTMKRSTAIVKKRKSPNFKLIEDDNIESGDDDANKTAKKKRVKTK
jgi:hypothetical protein